MRKSLFVGLLGLVLAVGSMFPFLESDAAANRNLARGGKSPTSVLPNLDIRLGKTGEFVDYDLNAADGPSKAAQNATTSARAAAFADFRAKLGPELADNLRGSINQAGAVKNLFIDGAPLSAPQSDSADNIARNFLKGNQELFALSASGVANLELTNEDSDGPIDFLEYFQTIGGIKVYDGAVQVAVDKHGQVLSVREGFLAANQRLNLRPAVSEQQGLNTAFAYAGRKLDSQFVEMRARGDVGESSIFANPLGPDYEDVLSELNVVRVGEKNAWHGAFSLKSVPKSGTRSWWTRTAASSCCVTTYTARRPRAPSTSKAQMPARASWSRLSATLLSTRPSVGWALRP